MALELAITFSDQSNSFACGVELGRIMEKMERGDDFCQNNGFPVRIENKDVLSQICRVFGYAATFGASAVEGWIDFIAIKISTSQN